MPLRPTVRLKLTLLYGGLFLVAGAVLLGVNYFLTSRSLAAQAEPQQARVGVVLRELAPEQAPGGPTERTTELKVPGPEVLAPDGRPVEDVLREYQTSVRNDTLHALMVQSGIALGLMAVASVGLGWVVAGRALRPLQHITAAARRLSEDNLHERLALHGPPDELKELADTFDAMLERLERAFDSQRRFVANASHELRTPLTIQRTLVEVTLADPHADQQSLREMAVAMEEAIGRSQRLIDSLLWLARSEQTLTAPEPADLAAAAALAVEQAGPEARAGDVTITPDLRPAPVTGNRALLERLVANLVENGVRHNRGGGRVTVETGTDGTVAAVRVANTGPVVPPEEVPGLFEPFRRFGQQRLLWQKGAGLGLSIVRAVAVAHRGRLKAVAQESGGLDITVLLPVPGTDSVAMGTGSAPGTNGSPVQREHTVPWYEGSAAPIATLRESAGCGADAGSPTSTPVASG